MLDITDIREFIDQMRNEEGYVGILLWGSRSTGTADTDSDYDLLVIVDREIYATGYEYSKTGVIAHYNIRSLNHLYIQCNRAYELWQRAFFSYYSKIVVVDEVDDRLSSFISSLEKDIDLREYPESNYTSHMKNREIQNEIERIRNKNLISSSDIYDRVYIDKVLVNIFERYAGECYYDRYLDHRWRGKAQRRLYDTEYAVKNGAWIFPDMKFVELWEKIYSERTIQNFDALVDYIWSKVEKKPKLKRIYAYGE